MGVRGLTGALMAGPMEQTKLVPFAYDQVRQKNLDMEASLQQGMETTIEMQSAMDSLGSIPGSEDEAEVLTKPFQDRLDKIHEQYGNDLGRAAPDLQRLAFDFMSNKSKEVKELEKATAGRAALQADINARIAAGTLDSKTGSAYLRKATADFNGSMDSYMQGGGEMYSGNAFNGSPVATPDIKDDMFKIQPLLKASADEHYGLTPIWNEDGSGIIGYENAETKVEYSSEEARSMATSKLLNSLPGYKEYANQQVELGLAGGAYDHASVGGLMGIEEMTNPLLQPLSSDSKEAAYQIKSAGAKTAKEYRDMQGIEKAQKSAEFQRKVNQLAEDNDMDPAEVEEYLANAEWKRLQSQGVIDDIAAGSAVGAFRKQSLSVKGESAQGQNIVEFDENPYRTGRVFTTDSMVLPGHESSDKVEGNLSSAQARLAEVEALLVDATTPESALEALAEERDGLGVDIKNLERSYVPLQVAEVMGKMDPTLFERLNMMRAYGIDPKMTSAEKAKKLLSKSEEINEILVDHYALPGYRDDKGKVNSEEFNKDLSALLSLSDFDFDAEFKNPSYVTANGVPSSQILNMVKDIRTEFSRFEDAEQFEATADYYIPAQFKGDGKIEPERVQVSSRAARIVSGDLKVTDPLLEGVALEDTGDDVLMDINTNINGLFGSESGPAAWAPQTYYAGWFEGKPAYIMDMAWYTDSSDKLHRIPEKSLQGFKYGGETFKDKSKRLVHLPGGATDQNNLKLQLENDVRYNLSAGRHGEANKAATRVARMDIEAQTMPKLQSVGISKIPSEEFTISKMKGPDGEATYTGYVTRELDSDIFNSMTASDGSLIYDPSTQSLKIEKMTLGDGQEHYAVYSLPSKDTEGPDKSKRDYFRKGDQKYWGNLEDLMFALKGGEQKAQDLVLNTRVNLLDNQK